MHYVIMGCGRVGSFLARALEADGNSVAVVDRDEASFRRLPSSFEGRRVVGIGFDRDTLVAAGIEGAYAFAAVSSGDNSNILAARVARETFGVEHVVARIYDPGRAQIYERLGIPTVATVQWATDQVMRKLVPMGALTVHQDRSGTVSIVEVPVDPSWVGVRYSDLEKATGTRLAYVSRLGTGVLPHVDLVHQDGDSVHLVLASQRRHDVELLLASAAPAGASATAPEGRGSASRGDH